MTTLATNTLKVSGATLYYEVCGSGPVLLCIPGGPTDAGMFSDLARRLADRYTVVCYDPRGHSRSLLDGTAEDIPVAVHADDAAALVAAASDEPAFVYGSSGGGTIGLELLTRHPELVRRLVAHEAPLMELLPDADRFRALLADVDQAYPRTACSQQWGGSAPSSRRADRSTARRWRRPIPTTMGPPEMTERMTGNFDLFVAHELRPIGEYTPDIETLKGLATKLVSAAGETSGEQAACRAAHALAEHVGIAVSLLPGAHGGWGSDPQDFADTLDKLLQSG